MRYGGDRDLDSWATFGRDMTWLLVACVVLNGGAILTYLWWTS